MCVQQLPHHASLLSPWLRVTLGERPRYIFEIFLQLTKVSGQAASKVKRVRKTLSQLNRGVCLGSITGQHRVNLGLYLGLLFLKGSYPVFYVGRGKQNDLFQVPQDQFESGFRADERFCLEVFDPLHGAFST